MSNDFARSKPAVFPTMQRLAKGLLRSTYPWQRRFLFSRGEFPFMLNAMNLLGTGAEIGVRQGTYSRYLLAHWRGEKLYSIDPWQEAENYLGPDANPVPQAEHDRVYEDAVRALTLFGMRSVILRQASPQAADEFTDEALDFCFIDARHQYEAVAIDLEAWFVKVKRGGVLAGHDYVVGMSGGILYGVKTAVDEFCRRRGLDKVLSHEPNYPSWFIFK